jgi:hypothetical protein
VRAARGAVFQYLDESGTTVSVDTIRRIATS